MKKTNKIEKIYKKLAKEQGIDKEAAFTHVGECMEYGDLLFTDGVLLCAINDTYRVVQDALKSDFPEAAAALATYFGVK